MAQLNILHLTDIDDDEGRAFAVAARDIAAKEIHGLDTSDIQPDSVSVLVVPVDCATSLSGADTEVQVLVSGNDWPKRASGQPADASEAKVYFDKVAAHIHGALAKQSPRRVYVWVTPFTASGWAS